MRLVFWMNMPSHHQKDFFKELSNILNLRVFYYSEQCKKRKDLGWITPPLDYYERYRKSLLRIIWSCFKSRKSVHVVTGYGSLRSWLTILMLIVLKARWLHYSEDTQVSDRLFIKRWMIRLYYFVVAKKSLGAGAIGSRAFLQFKKLGVPDHKLFKTNYTSNINVDASIKKVARKVRFLFLGKISEAKGADSLIEAAKLIKELDFTIDFIGPVCEGEEYLLRNIESTEQLNYRGVVKSSEINDVLANYHVLVFPSRYDGWGMVVHEAVANNLAVVCSECAGSAGHLVKEGVNGFIIEPSKEELARCLERYVVEPGLISCHSDGSKRLKGAYSPLETARRFAREVNHRTSNSIRKS